MASGQLSIRYKLKGPNSSRWSPPAPPGNHAIGDAFRIIQRGDADLMVAGGSEAIIDELPHGRVRADEALSTRNDEPTRASRPFDADRDGFVPGEGAGSSCWRASSTRVGAARASTPRSSGYGDDGRRLSHDRARSGRRRCGARDGAARCGTVGSGPRTSATSTRTARRPRTTTRRRRSPSSRCSATTPARLAVSSTKSMTGHLLRRRGRYRGDRHACSPSSRASCRRRSTTRRRTPSCDLDYVPNAARKAEVDARDLERLSGSAARTPRSRSGAGGA